jgi:hypothetical protein
MEKIKMKFAFAIFLLAILQSCASTPRLMSNDILQGENQAITYQNGKKIISSLKNHFVSLRMYRDMTEANDDTGYTIYVTNLQNHPINLMPENISIVFIGENGIQAMKIKTYAELMTEVDAKEKAENRGAFWQALSGALNAAAAGQSTSTTTSNGTFNGNYNQIRPYNQTGNFNGTYAGSSTTTNYDPARSQALANQNAQIYQNNLMFTSASAASVRQKIDSLLLRSQTIFPNQTSGVLVILNTTGMSEKITGRFELSINLEGEVHRFLIDRQYPH